MAKAKKPVEEEIDDKWSAPVVGGPWTMTYAQRKFNPYTTIGTDWYARHYEICLQYQDREMNFYISVKEVLPTLDHALKYLTDVLHIVEVVQEKKFKEPMRSIKANTYDIKIYEGEWEKYCRIAKRLKELVGEETYKAIIA
jgi:hypothetical protein